MVKAPITKQYKTLEEIKRMIELEDDFHDAELMDMAIKNGDAWFGIWQYGHRFTFVCREIMNLEMNMDLKLVSLYEVDIKQCEDGVELTFDEAGVVIKAKEVILEELILPKDFMNYRMRRKRQLGQKLMFPMYMSNALGAEGSYTITNSSI